jgi:hypothetical protein
MTLDTTHRAAGPGERPAAGPGHRSAAFDALIPRMTQICGPAGVTTCSPVT